MTLRVTTPSRQPIRQPIRPFTVSGWYEHTDGSWGYYSWRVAGGVAYSACDVVVPRHGDTEGPGRPMLEEMRKHYLERGQAEAVTWCELALAGQDSARAQCLAMLLGQREPGGAS